jgi:alanine racemase
MTKNTQYLKWIEISRSALAHNIGLFRAISPEATLAMAVVKSNAYGHGIREISSLAVKEGVDWLGVNELSEGITIREAGIDKIPVLIMGAVLTDHACLVVQNTLSTIVYTNELIDALNEAASRASTIATVHLKIETGLNRQGVALDQLPEMVQKIKNARGLKLEGVSTHFANIEDTTDHSFALQQLKTFKKGIEIAEEIYGQKLLAHCACSAAALAVPETSFSIFRMGIGMYGMWPSKETHLSVLMSATNEKTNWKNTVDKYVQLQPVMTFKCRIAQVKNVKTGSSIGYGATEQATHDSKIAVLPIGYYDGLDRRLSSKGQVLIKGKRAYMRGRICMNMCMIDVTHIENVKEGDEVIVLGRDGHESVSADLIASQLGTINYEVVTKMSEALPRIIVD